MKIEKEELKKQIRKWIRQGYIRPEEIPSIDLYVEQVIRFMDNYLSGYKRGEDDKTLTKTMVNNYTKNSLLPPTENKRYNSDHIVLLILIYYMKNVISISDIRTVLSPLVEDYAVEGKDDNALTELYKNMYELEKRQYFDTEDSILKTLALSEKKVEGEGEEDEYLKNFIFLCLLGYDVFMKRKVMEHIIDSMQAERSRAAEEKKAAEEKAARAKAAKAKTAKPKEKQKPARTGKPQKKE